MASYSPRLARQVTKVVRALWLVPVLMTVAGLTLGLAMPRVDAIPGILRATQLGWLRTVLDSAPAGAQQVLATSAGALATVLGVAFSLTLVTLQLATGQYTPRLVGWFLEDRVTKSVLGAFIGTVAYLLLVLRSVHGVGERQPTFVPRLSMALGLVLILGCLGLLAYFVHHLGGSIQVASLAGRISRRTMSVLASMRRSGGALMPDPAQGMHPEGHTTVHSDRHGYVQLVDATRVAASLPEGVSHALVLVAAGDFVLPDQPLLLFWPPRPLSEREEAALQRTVALGDERTEDQDVLYGVRLLADIGLKALSPSMNDETTAVTAVNQLAAVIAAATRDGGGAPWVRYDAPGRTVIAPGLTLRRMVEDGFGGIIRFSADHPRVLARIVEVLSGLVPRMPPGDGQAALLEAIGWVAGVLQHADLAPHERRLVAIRLEALHAHEQRPRVDGPHAMH